MRELLRSILLIVVFSSLQFLGFSQLANWYGADLSRLGYKNNKYVFEEVPTIINTSENFKTTEAEGGSFELSVDLYKKHVYFNLDAGSLLDMTTALFMSKDKERWFNNKDYYVDFIELIPIRLAFGSNITEYLGVYLGGQYSYTTIGVRYKSNAGSVKDVRMGGNTYGFGGHVVGAYSIFNLRYSYMYNWTSQASVFKGKCIDNELVLSLGFPILGIFLKYRHSFNMTKAGYLPEDRSHIFKKDYEYAARSWQSSQFANKSEFSVGLYAAGLFSGVTTGGSKALTDMERGLMKERQDDRKRKIIWKE